MNNLNSVLLEGNLVRDPELKTLPSGTALCKMSIASNRSYKSDNGYQKEVSYFDIVAWGKSGENCAQYLKKGSGIRVIGRLKQERWTGKDGGIKSRIVIHSDSVEFKSVNQVNNNPAQPGCIHKDEYRVIQAVKSQEVSNSEDNFDDDIPF